MQLSCIKRKSFTTFVTAFSLQKLILLPLLPTCFMIQTNLATQSDWWGAVASGLCLVHCLATPFIFVAQTCSVSCCHDSPLWRFIDVLFVLISWAAVYWSARQTTLSWMPIALYASWGALMLVLINDQWGSINLGFGRYIPAIALIVFHLIQRRYGQCGPSCATPTCTASNV